VDKRKRIHRAALWWMRFAYPPYFWKAFA